MPMPMPMPVQMQMPVRDVPCGQPVRHAPCKRPARRVPGKAAGCVARAMLSHQRCVKFASHFAHVAAAAILFTSVAARAADLPGASQPLTYRVVDQDVAGVIAGIAGQLGVRCDVSSKIQGQVHGRLPDGSVQDTLNRLASLYGFDWYFDGQTLYATTYQEARSLVLPLGTVPGRDLLATLGAFGIADARWPVRVSDDGGMAYVNGPPRMVNLAEGVLSALSQRAHASVADVRVFRGASAAGS